MAVKPTGIIRQLGWRKFFQLLTHLPSFVKLFSRLIKDPRVSASPKLIVAGILAYVILPTDLLPDFLIGVGQAGRPCGHPRRLEIISPSVSS